MKAEDEDKVLDTGELALGEIDGPQIVVASPVGPNAQPSKQEHKAQARLRGKVRPGQRQNAPPAILLRIVL
jgi:hypothetical protein